MLSPHLIRQIEQHAEQLAIGVVDELLHNPRTMSFRRIPRDEVLGHVREFYAHLGDWLAGRTDTDIDQAFGLRGRDRYLEGIPLEEMVWALVLVKRQLRHHTHQVSGLTSAAEIHSEMEVDAMVGAFFDKVIYSMVRGYERSRQEGEQPHRPPLSVLGDAKPGNIGWIP
jgi:hypothetical protein